MLPVAHRQATEAQKARCFLPLTCGVGFSLLQQILTDSPLPAAPSGRDTDSRLTGGETEAQSPEGFT